MALHWTSRLRPPRVHSDSWRKEPPDVEVCGYCGDAPVDTDEDRCESCLSTKAEKETDAMTPYNPITAACKLDPRIARIISGGSIVETSTAPGEDPVIQGDPPSPVGGSSRCICAHPGQHAECSPCRCTKETK
jgi:hypothetical protein